ncbi:hypothetical protein IMSAGC013_04403 [Lachnospiraceae bacterium]|nr:hypothetical protein IMSAGC013_04403 [Lachnospiraceae bacterium]
MEKNDVPGIIDNLTIIPDTNILLYLYKCSFNASKNIVDLLNKMKDKVIIPNRVYEEYISNKGSEQDKIDKKYDTFTRNLKSQVDGLKRKVGSSISESRKYEFPDCDALETGINIWIDKIKNSITAYESSLSSEKQNKSVQITNVEQIIQYWSNQQRIRQKPSITKILEYIKEGEFRYRYKMPPGYMDEDKDKASKGEIDSFETRIRKYGDLFVWKEILSIGSRENGKKVLFITNDVKEDWWVLKGEQKDVVCMRDELRQEYLGTVGNDNIEFMNLSKFYELFSDYYKMCDIKTTLELEYRVYVHGLVYGKYMSEIEEKMYERAEKIEWEDINPDFHNINVPDINIYGFDIGEITLHYDDDGETAFYDVVLSTDPFFVEINRKDGELFLLLGDVEIMGNLMIQIQRDLRNLDEDGLSIKDFSYDVLLIRDAQEVLLEREQDAKAEMDDALEEYYRH